MKTLDLDLLPKEAWRPVIAFCGRASNRISERELEHVPALLSALTAQRGKNRGISVRLWDYSSLGFAVLLNSKTAQEWQAHKGDPTLLTLNVDGEPMKIECRVQNISEFRGQVRLGLSRCDWLGPVFDSASLSLPDGAWLLAETPNPLLFGEWTRLRLVGLSSGVRLIFECEDSSLMVGLGRKMRVRFHFPTMGDAECQGRVERLERSENDGICFMLGLSALNAAFANDLSETLVSEQSLHPESLRALGLPLRFFRHRTSMSFVDNQEDYERVLHLRRNAYVAAQKKSGDTAPEAMSSHWDRFSRILCIHHENVLVASATLTFPDSEAARLRTQTAFPGGEYPCPVPPKTQFIEVSGLCTHHEYRKGDLLQAVFEHIARVFLLSDRQFILTIADDNLLPLYLSLGFANLKQTCIFLDRRHHLICGSRANALYGKGMSFMAWHAVFADVIRDLHDKGFLKLGWLDSLRVRLRLAIDPHIQKLLKSNTNTLYQKALNAIRSKQILNRKNRNKSNRSAPEGKKEVQ